jgi:hypothetical protein
VHVSKFPTPLRHIHYYASRIKILSRNQDKNDRKLLIVFHFDKMITIHKLKAMYIKSLFGMIIMSLSIMSMVILLAATIILDNLAIGDAIILQIFLPVVVVVVALVVVIVRWLMT